MYLFVTTPSPFGMSALRILSRVAAPATKRAGTAYCRFASSLSNGESLSDSVLFDRDEATGVATVTLNRPKAMNALNREVVHDLMRIFKDVSNDSTVRAVVLTGSEKVFAAGADIKEMLAMDYSEMRDHDRSTSLLQLQHLACTKPVVAAVNGFALGGGCELAMLCDIIVAADNAQFGQPEIQLGIMAGAGGTQRLTKAVGKSLAMQMNLTGEPISAERALQVTPANESPKVPETHMKPC